MNTLEKPADESPQDSNPADEAGIFLGDYKRTEVIPVTVEFQSLLKAAARLSNLQKQIGLENIQPVVEETGIVVYIRKQT